VSAGFSAEIEKRLQGVIDPQAKESVARLGMVEEVAVTADAVELGLILPAYGYEPAAEIRAAIEKTLQEVPEVARVAIRERVEILAGGRTESIPGVKNVLLVASGKGGVGKSTVAANLAVALAADGARVGLLDCDIYGPSIPVLMGGGARPHIDEQRRIQPGSAHGIKLISMGFMVTADTPMVWRGPMLHGALSQFIDDVDWGDLDYLVLDLPPGTGDIQLTLSQKVDVAGAVIVTTPQQVALEDVQRGKKMFDDVQIATLGVIENMSYFVCPQCDKEHQIFGRGGGRRIAQELQMDFLGAIPIDPVFGGDSNSGGLLLVREPDAPAASALRSIARRVATRIAARNLVRRLI
jgi:ATP-binding protein involved in chromosome partitioning